MFLGIIFIFGLMYVHVTGFSGLEDHLGLYISAIKLIWKDSTRNNVFCRRQWAVHVVLLFFNLVMMNIFLGVYVWLGSVTETRWSVFR